MTRSKKRGARPMERHHRMPRSRGGTDNNPKHNVILVERALHRAWHSLFSNMTPAEVASAITDMWIAPNYYLVAIPRKRKKCEKKRTRAFCLDCEAEVLKHLPTTTNGE